MNATCVTFPAMKWSEKDLDNRDYLSRIVRKLNQLGECPATSGNYSFLTEYPERRIAISRSGVDKEDFSENHFCVVDENGQLVPEFCFPGVKASDETLLHTAIYKHTDAGCVLHVHGLASIRFADLFPGESYGKFSGMEMMKAFSGTKTHETTLKVPIFENTQDIASLADQLGPYLQDEGNAPGFIMRGHGLYTWGRSVKEAKRHYEAFHYLFAYYTSIK